MAMIECKACGKRVSNTKKKCRYCGAKVKRKSGLLRVLGGVIVVLAVLLVVLPAISSAANRIKGGGVDTSITVPPGELYFHEIVLNRPGGVSVTAVKQSGPTVDLYFINESSYRQLETDLKRVWIGNGPSTVSHIRSLSKEGLSGRFESSKSNLSKGSYFIVVDNSDYGGTKSGGASATVDVKVQGK